MSGYQLAKLAGVTPAAVWSWENKGVTPRSETLADLAKALSVTPEFLRTGEQSKDEKTLVSSAAKRLEENSLEDLMRAIEAKGFAVSVSPKSAAS
jgi:transcriptional regulator with XRE-family HTH domain